MARGRVTRLCLDQLRSARVRSETPVGPWLPEPPATAEESEVANAALLAESPSIAFLLLLDTMTPKERPLVLRRDVFDHAEIAAIVAETAANGRQPGACAHVAALRPRRPASLADHRRPQRRQRRRPRRRPRRRRSPLVRRRSQLPSQPQSKNQCGQFSAKSILTYAQKLVWNHRHRRVDQRSPMFLPRLVGIPPFFVSLVVVLLATTAGASGALDLVVNSAKRLRLAP